MQLRTAGVWIGVVTLGTLARPASAACPAGQAVSADTVGHCCWPMQVWSGSRETCVGTPQCPEGLSPQGEACVLVCPAGMEAGADTAGHCCWPMQVWSQSRQVCLGTPTCPSGMRVEAERCVAQALPPPPPVPPPAETGPASAPPPQIVPSEPAPTPPNTDVTPGHHVDRQARKGLLFSGIGLLAGGWAVSVLVAAGGGIYAAYKPANTCWGFASSVGWIPLVGPAIGIVGQSDPSLHTEGNVQCTREPLYPIGLVVSAASTILQWAGLSMMVLGLVLRTPVVVPDEPVVANASPPAHWFVSLGSAGSPVGVTFGLSGW